jgi:hypothetical protein
MGGTTALKGAMGCKVDFQWLGNIIEIATVVMKNATKIGDEEEREREKKKRKALDRGKEAMGRSDGSLLS